MLSELRNRWWVTSAWVIVVASVCVADEPKRWRSPAEPQASARGFRGASPCSGSRQSSMSPAQGCIIRGEGGGVENRELRIQSCERNCRFGDGASRGGDIEADGFQLSASAFRPSLRLPGHRDEADGEDFAADQFAVALLLQNDEFLGCPA